jgi:cell division septum initiation protein DivIVA
VRLSITEAEHEDLRKAQALLGHAVPSGDPAEVYARAMKHYLAHLEKQRFGTKPAAAAPAASSGRGIPKPLRRFVWERDGARCTFVGTGGHRCEETRRLEIDHILPVAMGGRSTPENLRILCRAHNQHEADRVLGKERVQARREVAQRERARARDAARASAARAKERDAAHQSRHDDIVSALRGLDYSVADASRGAALADAVPDASLEACVKLALAELSRPLRLRGERMARCTA